MHCEGNSKWAKETTPRHTEKESERKLNECITPLNRFSILNVHLFCCFCFFVFHFVRRIFFSRGSLSCHEFLSAFFRFHFVAFLSHECRNRKKKKKLKCTHLFYRRQREKVEWCVIAVHWCQSVELRQTERCVPYHFSFPFARTDRWKLVLSSRPPLLLPDSGISVRSTAATVCCHSVPIDGKMVHGVVFFFASHSTLRQNYALCALHAVRCQSAHNDYAGECTLRFFIFILFSLARIEIDRRWR